MSVVHSQSPSVALTVIAENVKGLTAGKESILSEICKEQVFKKHTDSKTKQGQGFPGMALVAERPHNKHGSSAFLSGEQHLCL